MQVVEATMGPFGRGLRLGCEGEEVPSFATGGSATPFRAVPHLFHGVTNVILESARSSIWAVTVQQPDGKNQSATRIRSVRYPQL
jgi:hypothetical protein